MMRIDRGDGGHIGFKAIAHLWFASIKSHLVMTPRSLLPGPRAEKANLLLRGIIIRNGYDNADLPADADLLRGCRPGQVSAAARMLNLTQPAASQQLRELERCLRVRLLDRAGGRSVPTAAGAALLEPARRAQGAIEEAVAVAEAFRGGDTGRVRLGSGATACIHLLPRVLADAKQRMSGLEVIVATGDKYWIWIRHVEVGELDLALVTMPVMASRAIERDAPDDGRRCSR